MQPATVPLSALRACDAINSRSSNQKEGVAALTASIKAHGLLTPLTVRATPDEMFEVIDGNTRLAALKKIAGKKGDMQVPVSIVKADDSAAHEASLAANVVRKALHPCDEFEAYARLLSEGASIETIAGRFAVSARWVSQRLQLAAIAPELRAAWREGKIDSDQAEAFSAVANHDRQREVWKEVSKAKDQYYRGADHIRRTMMQGAITANDKRIRFIGLEAYKAAGGAVSEDLFTEAVRAVDELLLNRLVLDRFEKAKAEFIDQGFAWAKTVDEIGLNEWQIPTIDLLPWATPAERAAVAKATQDYQRREILKDAYARAIDDPEARAKSGVALFLGHSGELQAKLFCSLPDADDQAEAADQAEDEGSEGEFEDGDTVAEPAEEDQKPRIPQAVHESLAETMSRALSAALASDPDVGFRTIIATLQDQRARRAFPQRKRKP